ncbi:hypothetical protein DSO57_1020124 [Entomophthora muscae]|uniref:Uncharacterized protein n=1 Tax=Entomophthora muscae TaxID=34485 RepID=A0ACC2TF99_9FUNG|nr:hypothetical protein DSO57_1020124 [Entomophthora muscae]
MPNCPWHHTRPAQLPTLLKPVLESIRPPLPNQFKSENQSESSLRFPKRLTRMHHSVQAAHSAESEFARALEKGLH